MGALVLHYQPQVVADDGRPVGVEALIRWRHPEMGLLPPSAFIPVAEETGLIAPLSGWALRTACIQGRRWLEGGIGPLRVAINISAHQLRQPGLVGLVAEALAETGLPPALLVLEIPEAAVIADPAAAAAVLAELRAMGVQLAIDGVGADLSNLSSFKRFPLDRLKIDPSFVAGLMRDAGNVAIVRAIIAMANGMKLAVVAGGVEQSAQLAVLRRHGCEEIQGFLVSPPLPVESLNPWLLGGTSTGLWPAVITAVT